MDIKEENEDDGYVMTAVYNWRNKQSSLKIWDSKKMSSENDGLALEAKLKQRVPYGFHTLYVDEAALE